MNTPTQPGTPAADDSADIDGPGPAGASIDASPYGAARLLPEDDSLRLPADVAAPSARVDIAAAVAAAGLVGDAPGPGAEAGRATGAAGGGDGGGGGGGGGTPARRGAAAAPRRRSEPSGRQQRRFARERAVQALYQWHMTGASSGDVRREFLATQEMDRVDVAYFEAAFRGVTLAPEAIDATLSGALDRELAEVDPIERAILRLGTWELANRPDVPALVVVNEAVEIAARFCAEPGRRYVNGVLDALATRLRSAEMGRA